MLRIGTACGSGLGSSFMVQMNIESVLKELGVTNVEVEHYDLGGANPNDADIGDVRILNGIIDMDELKELVTRICQEKGLI